MEDAETRNGLVKSPNSTNETTNHVIVVEKGKGPTLCSARWRLTYLLFFTFMLLYMHRVNLSLAVVCMVKTKDLVSNASEHLDTSVSEHLNDSFIYQPDSNYSLHKRSLINGTTVDLLAAQVSATGKCSKVSESSRSQDFVPELDWDYTQVSFLLSSYFYGSFFTQVPAGRLADYFGGKHIITATNIVTATCSLLVPVCARVNFYLMLVLRITIGLAGGAVIPVGIAMLNVWALPTERATMIGFASSGAFIGTIISYLTSGLLCVYGFDNGWPTIFYFHGFFIGTILSYLTSGLLCVYGFDNGWPTIFYAHGILSCILVFIWCIEAYSRPEHHPRISKQELDLIQNSRKSVRHKPDKHVPWLRIFTSRPMWAVIIVHFACNWSVFTILINVPLFLEEVLKYGVRQNGLYSALPYVFCAISTISSPKVAQTLINKHILGHLFTRRLFTGVSLVIIAIALVGTGYVTCANREVAVVLLCVTCFFTGTNFGGFLANHAEFGGQHAGTIYGITNAGGVISALLASMTAGLLTPNGLQSEWQLVFYISAGISILGALIFVTCSSVTLQDWALGGSKPDMEISIEIEETTKPLKSEET